MTPHVRLQRVPTGMIARLPLTIAPFAHILRLLRPTRRAVRALHVLDQLVVVRRLSERAVPPQALRLRLISQRILVVCRRARRAAEGIGGDGDVIVLFCGLGRGGAVEGGAGGLARLSSLGGRCEVVWVGVSDVDAGARGRYGGAEMIVGVALY